VRGLTRVVIARRREELRGRKGRNGVYVQCGFSGELTSARPEWGGVEPRAETGGGGGGGTGGGDRGRVGGFGVFAVSCAFGRGGDDGVAGEGQKGCAARVTA
jgi:hypothetical protein